MNRTRTLGLMKLACAVTAVLGAVLFFAVAPEVLKLPGVLIAGLGSAGYWFGLGYVWAVGALCFGALWQAWKICVEIGRDNSFSMKNARLLKRIQWLMTAACGLMAAGLALYLAVHGMHPDSLLAPGLIVLGVCISLVFALFAAALAEPIRMGAELKDENDLTI